MVSKVHVLPLSAALFSPRYANRWVISVSATACSAVPLRNEELVVVDQWSHLEGATVRTDDDITFFLGLEI